jgi:hypothetical protein
MAAAHFFGWISLDLAGFGWWVQKSGFTWFYLVLPKAKS